MRILRLFLLAAFGASVLTAAAPAKANKDLVLTPSIQAELMAAKPVRGKGVDRETFNGKPVLVVFFASW